MPLLFIDNPNNFLVHRFFMWLYVAILKKRPSTIGNVFSYILVIENMVTNEA